MNIKEVLLRDHSKATRDIIVNWIGTNQKRFNILFNLFLDGDDIITQRASWSLSYAVQANPKFIARQYKKLLLNLKKPRRHDAVKRNTLRLLQEIMVPDRFRGELMDTCFKYIASLLEKPSIKAFSLTILFNLTKQYPDISHELKTIIENGWDNESPAFKSRARKILKTL